MRYSKLATILNQKHQHRQFKAFPACEVIAIAPKRQYAYSSFWLKITKYRFSFNLVGQPTLSVIKLNT